MAPCGLADIGGRGAEMTAKRAIEIGDVAEAAFVGDLRNVQMSISPVGQHAPRPEQPFRKDEGGERRAFLFEQLPQVACGNAVMRGEVLLGQTDIAEFRQDIGPDRFETRRPP